MLLAQPSVCLPGIRPAKRNGRCIRSMSWVGHCGYVSYISWAPDWQLVHNQNIMITWLRAKMWCNPHFPTNLSLFFWNRHLTFSKALFRYINVGKGVKLKLKLTVPGSVAKIYIIYIDININIYRVFAHRVLYNNHQQPGQTPDLWDGKHRGKGVWNTQRYSSSNHVFFSFFWRLFGTTESQLLCIVLCKINTLIHNKWKKHAMQWL